MAKHPAAQIGSRSPSEWFCKLRKHTCGTVVFCADQQYHSTQTIKQLFLT